MPIVNLKKILKKPEFQSVIESLLIALNTQINICDPEGNLIFGDPNLNFPKQFIIKTNYQIIGWLKGGEEALPLAKFLNYAVKQELDKKSLAEETLDKYTEINFLYDVSEKISRCLKVEEIVGVIINEVNQIIEATDITVMLLNPETQILEFFPSSFQDMIYQANRSAKIGIANYVLESGKAEIVNDVFKDSRYIQGSTRFRSLICAPLNINNRTIGVINISHHKPMKYSSEDLKLFTALTSQAAASIQTAQYYAQLKEYSQTLEQKVQERTLELEHTKKDLEKLNKELHILATVDQLTQLANRRQFDQSLQSEWKRMSRTNKPLSFILCDIDYFKKYNDHYGHPEGDRCLKQVAKVLQESVSRCGDLVARYGGEEFALILPNTSDWGALKIAQDIQAAVADLKIPHCVSQVSEYVTVSMGIATAGPEENLEAFIKKADIALYRAKEGGRDQYCFYENR
ncbi:MAG: hypothetical protein N5P05_003151 [Chroococcopsis gigantea SAG 12.99]|jgi:diguanylate cyclase (GGDEF)-like protein|nr:diguanylate cyclase [Chlorogloea purpurea SAG 13.99]MDV3001545.1 hypothetical protein [Chroococcopsis gigantea SAG 12.99]